MPSNTSAATAETIGSFPFSATVDPGDAGGGNANDLWYRIAPSGVPRVFGAYVWTDYSISGNTYLPDFYLYTGDDPGSLVAHGFLGFGIFDLAPAQFVAQPDVTYWIKIKDHDNWDPGDLMTLTVQLGDSETFVPIGSILINGDKEDSANVLLDATTGAVLRVEGTLPAGETGAILPDGTIILENATTHTLEIWSDQLELIADGITRPTMGSALAHTPLTHDGTNFYALGYTQNVGAGTLTVRVSQISPLGSIDATWTFTLTGSSDIVASIAVSQDGSRVLYMPRSQLTHGVQRYDLNGSVLLSDFIAPGVLTTQSAKEIYALEDTSVLLGMLTSGTTSQVQVYSAAGALVRTISTGNVLDHFHPGATDATFVAWTQQLHSGNTSSVFTTYRVSDGATLNATDALQTFNSLIGYYGSGTTPPYPEHPPLFGNESSCPILIMRVAIGEEEGGEDLERGTIGPFAWVHCAFPVVT